MSSIEGLFSIIDESRGSKACPEGSARRVVRDILGEKYEGVLGCDFLSAHNELNAEAKQRCLMHFLREVGKVQEKKTVSSDSVDEKFCPQLKAVLKETIDPFSFAQDRIWNRHREGTAGPEDLARTKDRAVPKMVELVSLPLEHEDTQRVSKRIMKYNQSHSSSSITHRSSPPISGLSGI